MTRPAAVVVGGGGVGIVTAIADYAGDGVAVVAGACCRC